MISLIPSLRNIIVYFSLKGSLQFPVIVKAAAYIQISLSATFGVVQVALENFRPLVIKSASKPREVAIKPIQLVSHCLVWIGKAKV